MQRQMLTRLWRVRAPMFSLSRSCGGTALSPLEPKLEPQVVEEAPETQIQVHQESEIALHTDRPPSIRELRPHVSGNHYEKIERGVLMYGVYYSSLDASPDPVHDWLQYEVKCCRNVGEGWSVILMHSECEQYLGWEAWNSEQERRLSRTFRRNELDFILDARPKLSVPDTVALMLQLCEEEKIQVIGFSHERGLEGATLKAIHEREGEDEPRHYEFQLDPIPFDVTRDPVIGGLGSEIIDLKKEVNQLIKEQELLQERMDLSDSNGYWSRVLAGVLGVLTVIGMIRGRQLNQQRLAVLMELIRLEYS